MGRIKKIPIKVAGIPVSKDTAVSLAKATRDVVLRRSVPDETMQKRMATCQGCPSWTGYRCSECGCVMKTKAKLASSTCPLGKWDNYIPDIRE